jgi:hypothetical protein
MPFPPFGNNVLILSIPAMIGLARWIKVCVASSDKDA